MPEPSATARAVFLSYAREDTDAARRIADALRAFGVEVWLDQSELRGGDEWDRKIRQQIRECALFVPVISGRTQERAEGYFRREWKLAVERTHDMAAGVAFIVPVVVDETVEAEALAPEEFLRVQWTRLANGVPTPEFVQQVKRLLESPRKPVLRSEHAKPPTFPEHLKEAARARQQSDSTPPAPAKSRRGWTLGAVTAVVVGIATAVYVSSRQHSAPAPAEAAKPKPAAPAPAVAAPAVVNDKSVAVLPFTSMSEEKDSAFFTDGMHEDVLTNLALVRELRVVSRTSVMQYRGTTKPIKQIAQELGVAYILEGSVRRVGNKVRVTGQLIHAATDEHVWAQAYDRDITDVFAIQSELSQQIAGALKAALSPEEKALLARKPTDNPEAYDLFLRARDLVNREGNGLSTRTKQISLLERAVALDPKFAQGWGELAAACAYWGFVGFEGMEAALARAKVAIERAQELAPDDPAVVSSLGTYYYYGFRDYDRANAIYERLARLQPNSPSHYNSLALIQRRQGKWLQSLANSRRAIELDPANLSYLRNVISTLRAGRRWREATDVQRQLAARRPDSLRERYLVAEMAFSATGSKREAEQFFAGLTPSERESPEGIAVYQTWLLTSGDHAGFVRSDRIHPYVDETFGSPTDQAYLAAFSYFVLGDVAGARARLGTVPAEMRARAEREPGNQRAWVYLGGVEMILGHKEESLRCINRAVELLPESRDALDGPQFSMVRVIINEFIGDREFALAEYARLLRTPSPRISSVAELQVWPGPLRQDPRFQALLDDPANKAPLF